jgi:hypothetical protein
MRGLIVTILNSLTLYVGLITPLPLPQPPPAPQNIWSSSIIFPHHHLLHSPPPHEYAPYCTYSVVLCFLINPRVSVQGLSQCVPAVGALTLV